MIYLVRYVGYPANSDEGWVNNKEQFLAWLKEHNDERLKQGESKEDKELFELIPLSELK